MSLDDERDFVEFISQALGPESAAIIGDDTASVSLPTGRYSLTVDSQIAGVHFPPGLDEATLARRLLAVNLSDLAAAGADPLLALLALSAPTGFDHREFFGSLGRAAAEASVTVCGGDLTTSSVVSASLTLVGFHPEGRSSLTRAQAEFGDTLWIGGSLGESALGRHLLAAGARWSRGDIDLTPISATLPDPLSAERAIRRHLEPQPQLELGRWLSTQPRAAALDVSDGLALDLHRLLTASQVGAEIETGSLPIPEGVESMAPLLGYDGLTLALSGGEDYVLLFALAASLRPPDEFGAVPIGRITESSSVILKHPDGSSRPLPPHGWDHLKPHPG